MDEHVFATYNVHSLVIGRKALWYLFIFPGHSLCIKWKLVTCTFLSKWHERFRYSKYRAHWKRTGIYGSNRKGINKSDWILYGYYIFFNDDNTCNEIFYKKYLILIRKHTTNNSYFIS